MPISYISIMYENLCPPCCINKKESFYSYLLVCISPDNVLLICCTTLTLKNAACKTCKINAFHMQAPIPFTCLSPKLICQWQPIYKQKYYILHISIQMVVRFIPKNVVLLKRKKPFNDSKHCVLNTHN